MMTTLTTLHIITSVLIVIVVLMQFGKGAEAGLMMDSSSSSILPQKGNVMVKITVVLSIIFFGLSLTLASMRARVSQKSIFDNMQTKSSTTNAAPVAPATTTLPTSENNDKK